MRINFYDTRVGEDYKTVLVKEKAVNYACESKSLSPSLIARIMIKITSLNVMGEEHCYMLALNGTEHLIGVFLISKGTVNQTLTNPREIFLRALMVGASFIILCHNHPSGNPIPSKTDILVTQKISEAADLLGIPVADHIIIGEDSYFSFMEKGLMEQERNSL